MNDGFSCGFRQIVCIELELVTILRKEGRRGCSPSLVAPYRWLGNITGPGTAARKDGERRE